MSHLKQHAQRVGVTPQSEPMREDQVANSAGGFSWQVGPFERLRRFLVLGTEGGSYYASQKGLTETNIDALKECLATEGERMVDEIVAISDGGRAPKNDYAIFALAYVVAHGDDLAKENALRALPKVCRIGTHLFMFMGFLDSFGTLTGRAKRRAIGRWYTEKSVDQVAYQAVKYRQREGFSHRDALRLSHPASKVSSGNPTSDVSGPHKALFEWIVKGEGAIVGLPEIIEGYTHAQEARTPKDTADLVRTFNLPREALKTEHLTAPEVWEALLDVDMPLTAMIRNLANMTRIGVLAPNSAGTRKVIETLSDGEKLCKARIHPIAVLSALRTYASGYSVRGTNTWNPVVQIVDALDAAFYKAFGNVESSGKRFLLALDVSGSMGGGEVGGVPGLTPRDASAAMALVTAATEPGFECVGFTASGGREYGGYGGYTKPVRGIDLNALGDGLTALPISPRQRLDDAITTVSNLPFGATDCSLPMQFAQKHEREIDVFCVYTDSETWHGAIHPAQALTQYRKASGIDAKLVVIGMVANPFSIADPNDVGMLDVVGFDTATPNIITDFAAGRI